MSPLPLLSAQTAAHSFLSSWPLLGHWAVPGLVDPRMFPMRLLCVPSILEKWGKSTAWASVHLYTSPKAEVLNFHLWGLCLAAPGTPLWPGRKARWLWEGATGLAAYQPTLSHWLHLLELIWLRRGLWAEGQVVTEPVWPLCQSDSAAVFLYSNQASTCSLSSSLPSVLASQSFCGSVQTLKPSIYICGSILCLTCRTRGFGKVMLALALCSFTMVQKMCGVV
jgi:hypothetical protein